MTHAVLWLCLAAHSLSLPPCALPKKACHRPPADTVLDGDADHGLLYQSPHLPKPLHITLADPDGDGDRQLFSHYLWNASLLLAEFVEAGTLSRRRASPPCSSSAPPPSLRSPLGPPLIDFDITNLTTIELGAGTALPSLLAALLGARRVVVTDYPASRIITNLCDNARRNVKSDVSPLSTLARVEVEGHAWGELSTPRAEQNHHAFERILVCDCLWMPWQHDNLLKSIEWFLKDDGGARCWVVAGFHSGRAAMRDFFKAEKLKATGLAVEHIWERDVDGVEREWSWDRGIEDPGERKRWLAVAILKRI